MTVDNKDVVNVQIEDNMLKIVWLDQTWKEWQDLHDSAEMKELIGINNKKIKQAAESRHAIGKGKGFGKAASA